MRRKKIGIFTGYFLPHLGGVERYVDKLSSALSRLGYEIVIVTSRHGDQRAQDKNQNRSIYRLPVLDIAKERYPIPRVNSEYREMISQIEKEKIDYFLLNTRFHLTSLIGAKMAKRQSKPAMLIEHGTDHFTVGNKFLDFFGRIYEHALTLIMKRYVNKFYGVSKNSNIWSKHFGITASGIFYNAITSADKLTIKDYYKNEYSDSEIIITYAGRLIREKGILNLLEAFKKFNKNKNLRLIIAGDGDLLEFIKNKYTQKNIDILGRLDFNHVMSLYKRTDIFVYPSLYPEGLPTSILEAGLMESAIIATPKGGTEEVIINNEHGTIVDGSVESLYNAMKILIDNPTLIKTQSKKVMSRVKKHFDWDDVARKVDEEIKGFDLN